MNRIEVWYYVNDLGHTRLVIRNDIKCYTNEVIGEFEGREADMMWEIMKAVDYNKTPNCMNYGLYFNEKSYNINEEENKNPICCFCGKECENKWGNNPYPANKLKDTRCCNECNCNIVIPVRVNESIMKQVNDESN